MCGWGGVEGRKFYKLAYLLQYESEFCSFVS